MAHPNEELVRSAFDAFAKGDVDTLRESMDQDAVWYVPGRNQLSGDHRGRARDPHPQRQARRDVADVPGPARG
jgi:ketosteroid isomerase-like protein